MLLFAIPEHQANMAEETAKDAFTELLSLPS
jgi:hypothetical protein